MTLFYAGKKPLLVKQDLERPYLTFLRTADINTQGTRRSSHNGLDSVCQSEFIQRLAISECVIRYARKMS